MLTYKGSVGSGTYDVREQSTATPAFVVAEEGLVNKAVTQTLNEPAPYHVRVGRYMGIFEKTGTGYSAYVARLPGLGVAGHTLEETIEHLRTGIAQDTLERPWLYAKQT